MKKLLLLSAVLVALFLPTRLLASDRLLFQMAGPRDWAIRDFSIVAGRISDTTRDIIYVSPATYTDIASWISSIGSHAARVDEQVFSVTRFRSSRRAYVLFIPDVAVGDVMRRIILMCMANRQAVPAIVSEIADSFPHG